MIARRTALLAGVLFVSLALVTGAGSVSSTAMDRGFSANVADDGEAYLGVRIHDPTVTTSSPSDVALLTLENNLAQDLRTVQVDVVQGSPQSLTLGDVETPDDLDVGDDGTVMATIDCDASRGFSTETWTLDIRVGGETTVIELSREVTVTCDVPTPTPTVTPTETEAESAEEGSKQDDQNDDDMENGESEDDGSESDESEGKNSENDDSAGTD
jgi:hypothetical protein